MAGAGVEGRVALRQSLLGFSAGVLKQTQAHAQDVALKSAFLAKNVGQNTIMTTPSSLREGKPDRYWTGAMFHAYTSDVQQRGNRITVKWGWIDTKKAYFKKQEYGGFFIGKTITPMHALANSTVAVTNYLHDEGIH